MNCPNCYSILSATSVKKPVDTTIIHFCKPCDGIWVGGTSLKRLLATETSAPNFEKLIKHSQQHQNYSENRNCPVCEGIKLNEFKIREVEIDYSEECNGVYFDKGELEALIPELEKEGFKAGVGPYAVLEVIAWILLGTFF